MSEDVVFGLFGFIIVCDVNFGEVILITVEGKMIFR